MAPTMKRQQSGKRNQTKARKANKTARPKPRRKLEVKFNAEDRIQYLTGASQRKRQRRAFGLAMQRVKDRKEKLAVRAEQRKSKKMEEEEKEHLARSLAGQDEDGHESDDDDDNDDEAVVAEEANNGGGEEVNDKDKTTSSSKSNSNEGFENPKKHTSTTLHKDADTTARFGADVVVTTTYFPSDGSESSDDEDETNNSRTNGIDEQQRYAGSVKRFLAELKGNMPGKRRRKASTQGKGSKKGRHGAASMKGMGSASDLKSAQKALSMAESKKRKRGQTPQGQKMGKKKSKR